MINSENNEILIEDENDKNKELDLDNNEDNSSSNESNNDDIHDEDKNNDDDDDISEDTDPYATINALSDEEFLAYMSSGKYTNEEDKNKNEFTATADSESDKSNDNRNSRKSVSDVANNETELHDKSGFKPDADKEKNRLEQSKQSQNQTHDKKPKTEESSTQVDYKAVYEQLFKPFKANGKQIAPKSVEDIVSLMQMGSNFTQKMQVMAPMRKIVESLNKAEITKDEDINFLIDLYKGNKDAIKKLLNKHKVDPIDLDVENIDYVPNNNLVSDDDVEYADTLDDISESIPKIQEIINTVWDKKSKNKLLKDPRLLRALHTDIQSGLFDKIQGRLEIEKVFGRHRNTPDLEIYMQLVLDLENQKGKPIATNAVSNDQKPNTPKKDVPDRTKLAPNKAKAATDRGVKYTKEDLFNMSDEEIMRLSAKDLV